jgi:hypothetical protein
MVKLPFADARLNPHLLFAGTYLLLAGKWLIIVKIGYLENLQGFPWLTSLSVYQTLF